MVLVASAPPVAVAGFAVAGLGVAGVLPVAWSAAGRPERDAPGRAVAAVVTCGFAGFLVEPVVVGAVAARGVVVGLSTAVVAATAIVAFARALRSPQVRRGGGSFGPRREPGRRRTLGCPEEGVAEVTVELFAGGESGLALWMFAAFVVTFAITRVVVRMIRSGRGPFRDTTVGDVHVHHHVYGIFLMLISGAGEFVYEPDSPWAEVLAAVFGAGAALTLDEFALWLHLGDVYWAHEGRKSVDAVLVAAAIGAFLVLGARPFEETAEEGRIAFSITIIAHLALAFIAIVKGKIASGLIGIVVPFVVVVAAIRLAKPDSPWARLRYPPGSRRLERARARYRRNRWDPVKDLLAGAPTEGRT